MKLEKRMVPEYGITIDGVWLPLEMLGRLNDQHRYDSEYGGAFTEASPEQERVLLAHNLAVKEIRGGLHSSDTGLDALLKAIWREVSLQPCGCAAEPLRHAAHYYPGIETY